MNSQKKPIHKIEEAFKAAYGREEDFTATPVWADKVMREIRRIGLPSSCGCADPEGYGQLVWRFCAVTCLLALVVTLYAVSNDFSTASEVARLFLEDPLAIDMVHFLEVV